MKKADVSIWCCGVFLLFNGLQSCSRDEIGPEVQNEEISEPSNLNTKKSKYYSNSEVITYSLSDRFQDESVVAVPCESTDFANVLAEYFDSLLKDPIFDFDLLNYYRELNTKYVTYYRGDNYYGQDGEFNNLAKKRIRELTKFWGLDREVILNGQHTSWLNDREILADMIESFDRTVRNRSEAYSKADVLMELNGNSANFPENPYFAFDAFAKSNGLLVIGDGLIQSIIETGIDGDLAFTAVLSHEWWHQAQFEHDEFWDYKDKLSGATEISRFSELEADFSAAYFLAHKRGATYNWKRIEEYFTLAFNVGDCLVESMNHHGTPQQRLEAAEAGFQLAISAKKKGFILTASQVHEAFLELYESKIL